MRKKAEYYYGDIDTSRLLEMGYLEALTYKIVCAKELLDELLAVELAARDLYRIKDIQKAICFNKELISEATTMQLRLWRV